MKARDVMNRNVVATSPDASRRSVAILLARNGISAVPVVDDKGFPIGMISEGDLMPRDETERLARRDWWLKALAEGEDLNPEFIHFLETDDRAARDMMNAPVITVDENAEVIDVAEILSSKRIKRVPVMSDGRMVGILSRADLVRAFADKDRGPQSEPSIDLSTPPPLNGPAPARQPRKPVAQVSAQAKTGDKAGDDVSATGFRDLALHFKEHEIAQREDMRHQIAESHHKQAQEMMAARLSEASWQHMLRNARAAAQKGEEEQLLLRFPAELCTDHGRAINAPDANWPTTLRGLAAEVFMRWKKELQPHGFGLVARVVEFPDGMPGDIGLFLAWGRKDAA